MARCPNCDRETIRTKDWVCFHCGYPLLSGSYKTIDNTYRELKALIESGQITEEEIGQKPPKKSKQEPAPKQRPQPRIERKQEPVKEESRQEPPKPARPSFFGRPKPQPAAEQKPELPPESSKPTRPSFLGRPKPQPAAEQKPEPPRNVASTPAPKPAVSQAPRPAPEAAAKPAPPPRPAPPQATATPQAAAPAQPPMSAIKPEPAPAVKPPAPPTPTQPVMEISVADLISTYETEGPAAEAKFAGKILKLSGAIDKINVRDALNIYQITLNSPKKNVLLQGVRCIFDKSHSAELGKLAAGQNVTVQGKYDGSIIDISLRDCFLVG